MTDAYYRLPPDLTEDIDAYEQEVQGFLAGTLPAGVLKAKRVPRGVYEQRQDGTYMVRVRVAGGTLTCAQTRELAALAAEYGNGLLHVTTRQDVQLHDIAIQDTPGIMRRLMVRGLTSKGGGGNTVRNVTACPYAGICPHEHFDVTAFAHAVTEYLIPLVGSYNLPRKYKVAFSGCAADCALAQVADLGFIAETRDNQPGFRVVGGGGMGAHSRVADKLLDWVPVSEVIRIAEAVRRLFDQLGDRSNRHRARLRYVFERLGVDRFRERLLHMMAAVAADRVPEWRGECRLNGSPAEAAASAPALKSVAGVRCFPQRQKGFFALPLHLPLGLVSAADFAKIGELAQTFSEESGPRTTRAQNLLIRFVREDNLSALTNALQQLHADVLSPLPLARFVACAGAATCRLGLCLAREAARACADGLGAAGLAQGTLDDMQIYINGCPNACGQQPVGQIGCFGVARRIDGRLVPCYRITLGGQCNADGARLGVAAGQVPARAMPALLADLATDFQSGRRRRESFCAYYDRKGKEHFERMVVQHANVPPYADHPEYYRDFGLETHFSLAGRGAGECGTGVFEVIQEDLTAAGKAEAPFAILLPTARALLITRGVDARDPDSVLREFENHFVDTGLVAETFRALLTRARGYTQGWQQALDGYEETVGKLLARVKLLYSTLDANLEFHPPENPHAPRKHGGGSTHQSRAQDTAPPTSPADPPPLAAADNRLPRRSKPSTKASHRLSPGEQESGAAGVTAELDLRDVACPMNFAKAKLRLEEMNVGEALAIVLDDGDPIQNVPASLRTEGQAIEATTDLGDGHWRVVVRKAK